jgi:hypothetical protein
MEVLEGYRHCPESLKGAALAIGNFDGVHRGHQAVLQTAQEAAKAAGAPAGVMTFEPHPRQFFQPDAPLFRLTPEPVKLELFAALGLDFAAVLRFDAALAIDAGNDAAKVGKARALVNLGRYAEAAAAVSGVPTTFLRVIAHSENTSDQENPIFNLQSNGRYSLSEKEGGNGLPFRSAGDPRIPWVASGTGFDGINPLFLSQKYSESRSAPDSGG